MYTVIDDVTLVMQCTLRAISEFRLQEAFYGQLHSRVCYVFDQAEAIWLAVY